jgi:hypothetical protein
MSHDNVLHDSPQEYFREYVTGEGRCDAQAIVPRGEGYACHCTCGRWDVFADDRESGLAMAREHTRELTERALAGRPGATAGLKV